MIHNRSVPTDIMLAHVYYENVSVAARWLTQTFGFIENYRYGDPIAGLQMHLGQAYVMLSSLRPRRESPARVGHATQSVTIFVEDVDRHYDKTKSVGAKIVEEINETGYGELQYVAEDLEGHHWLFSKHVRDVNPADWGATLAK